MRLYGARVSDATKLLRPGSLSGRRIVLTGEVRDELRDALRGLGAEIVGADDPHAGALAHCASGLDPQLEETWSSVVAVANQALIPAGDGGKIILIAPAPDAGPHAGAVRAALENLARTLCTEWARYQITTTTIAPGAQTTADELNTLVCFLASRAGDYFSGCLFELGLKSAR